MSTVIIFRNELLPISETFIEAQVRSLKSFQPRYVGLVRVRQSLPLPADTIFLCGRESRFTPLLAATYKSVAYPRHIYPEVRKAGANLLHAHFALDGATALPLRSYLNIPLLVTLHGYDVTTSDATFSKTIGGRLYIAKRKQLWEKASLFLCVSQFIRRKAIEAGFPEEKLLVHYIGIDRRLFEYVPKQTRRRSVLFVARLVEKKGSPLIFWRRWLRYKNATRMLNLSWSGPVRNARRWQSRRKDSPSIADSWVLSPRARFISCFSLRGVLRPKCNGGNGRQRGFGNGICRGAGHGSAGREFRSTAVSRRWSVTEKPVYSRLSGYCGLGQYIERLILTIDSGKIQPRGSGLGPAQFDLEEARTRGDWRKYTRG